MKAKRSSNLELLKILAMLLIIASHIMGGAIKPQLTEWVQNGWHTEYFCHPILYKRLCILEIAVASGKIGNALFLLISGYFLANKSSENIDLTKKAKKLLLMMGYATTILVIVSAVCRSLFENINSYVEFTLFNTATWWFVGYYFLVILFGKLFFNNIILRLDKKKYLMLVVTIFTVVQLGWSNSLICNLSNGLEIFVNGIFIYVLGGYIHKYNPFTQIRTWIFVAIVAVTYMIICIDYYIRTLSSINTYNAGSGEELFIQNTFNGYDNRSLVVIIIAVALFELFKRLPNFYSRVINYFGAATFMVYLLHENELGHAIWKHKDWLTPLYESSWKFALVFLMWIVGTFFVCSVLYSGYLLLGKVLNFLKPLAVKK